MDRSDADDDADDDADTIADVDAPVNENEEKKIRREISFYIKAMKRSKGLRINALKNVKVLQ